jgi:hypothetical protein
MFSANNLKITSAGKINTCRLQRKLPKNNKNLNWAAGVITLSLAIGQTSPELFFSGVILTR